MRQFCRFYYCWAWFDTVEFNRLSCSNEEMYDDVVFADRFRYPEAVFNSTVLMGLSRLLHSHNAYEIDAANIIAALCGISYCLSDLIRMDSFACHVQTTRYTMMKFSPIDSFIHWLWLGFAYWWVISTLSCSYCIWDRYCQNHRRILPSFLLFVWFHTVEFNRLLCPNDKMHDNTVFADRFPYDVAILELCILLGLSRLFDIHIAYEIDI